MAVITTAKNIRSTNYQNDVYFVFENLADGAVKLRKITRAQLDNLVAQNNQQQLVTNAATILTKAGYGNGQIDSMDLFADRDTGVVRLTIALAPQPPNNDCKVFMGRIDSGNWVACANTPITIDSTLLELEHANGTASEANAIKSSNGTLYLEGH
jgi:hypothetical protein